MDRGLVADRQVPSPPGSHALLRGLAPVRGHGRDHGLPPGLELDARHGINYAVLAPIMMNAGVIPLTGGGAFRRISTWSLWIGVPMMVTSGLLLFFIQWKTVVRAFSTITAMFRPRRAGRVEDPMDRIEVPGSWFVGGVVTLGVITLWVGHHFLP